MDNINFFEENIELAEMKNYLNSERFNHTQKVVKAAVELAEIHGADLDKVKTAAYLHDIAKSFSKDEIEDLLKDTKWEINKLEWSISAVLHAPAGAEFAKIEFNIKNYEILEAIRYHTLGHPNMGIIAQIIYAADFVEEDRKFKGLDKIRKVIKADLDRGIYLISHYSILYQLELDNPVHPYTNELRNKFLLKRSDN
ncbi:bis(5'-nucleosyl)-tetraphosphatase (symmetrical) YqeK [Halanaerobium hydrogeniformans]|uniref:bis(5'-nucleosyl)-tetraphosphatase (symmetrical) n=1 Tax=Halanaerobium hydrogeniformans TaxID=656519 RepID=E4RIQ9_HALHG|nr:bis(5'-nucleosyl)-tetraphosphatase (symmetrical) YqeK [Halanaerobium hydrogeniformans]ADQ15129.1 metal dependent phosphohydrolase [Halanaerobium hydrogeniformans]